MHKGICVNAVLAILRGWQIRLGKCHLDEARGLQCHCSDGQDRRMGREGLAGIEVRSKHVDMYESSDMQRLKQHAGLQAAKIQIHLEAMNWVCDDSLDDHVCVSERTISCQEAKVLEALQYDLGNPCIVQWSMLWFSAPTNLNRRFLNGGTTLQKYNAVINLALVATFTLLFGRMHTPRICFSRSMRSALCRSLERDLDVNREMRVEDWLGLFFAWRW